METTIKGKQANKDNQSTVQNKPDSKRVETVTPSKTDGKAEDQSLKSSNKEQGPKGENL
jgi:hypothetical protein